MSEWISVNDERPYDGQKVITIDDRRRIETAVYHIPYYHPTNFKGAAFETLNGRWPKVTHWMPLPEPPKEVE